VTIEVNFVDTSVLCNLLPVAGFDQNRDAVVRDMDAKFKAGIVFILPMTTVIETGNHIAQLPDGGMRRGVAERFSAMLDMVIAEKAPWTLHQFLWGKEFLDSLIAGCGTGSTLIDHATRKFGAGDLCILAEKEIYKARTRISNVSVWTLDGVLEAHN
jgi:hypothetical protein